MLKSKSASIMNQLQPETRELSCLLLEMPSRSFASHFDQPNILAHMRVNDRVVDGKKTLFIEEIQSDWHQKGRKKGYHKRATKFLKKARKNDTERWELSKKLRFDYSVDQFASLAAATAVDLQDEET
jgi:hypothetical protein